MKTYLTLGMGLLLLIGCAAPSQQIVVVNENASLKCEPPGTIQIQMLALINDLRKAKRKCGSKVCQPVGPVKWNRRLAKAARRHSIDMTRHDMLSHTGSDGSTVSKRVEKLGYTWHSVGENISAGRETSEQVVLGWLESPGHCANIMNPTFTEIGAACSRNKSTTYGTYWTLVLASP